MRLHSFQQWIAVTLLACFCCAAASANENESWWHWRGPSYRGQANKALPTKWSADSIAWKTKLSGRGQSSPIVVGDKILLTSALEDGRKRAVSAYNAKSGKRLWETVVWTGTPEKTHQMNNRASSTCASDGERVIAFFGVGGLHCLSLDGKHQWKVDLGSFQGPWGTGASPIIVDDIVIQNCDADGEAFLVGVNKNTGAIVWKTKREPIRGWSSPIVMKVGDRDEVIINGHSTINAYDPKTGNELWTCKASRGRGTPTLAPLGDNAVISVCGRGGDVVAVKIGGEGDVTGTQELWRVPRRGGRDLPSPLVVGNQVIVFRLRPGTVDGYDTKTGEEIWKKRLKGGFSASPIVANGLVYVPNEQGVVYVVKPGKSLEIISENNLKPEDDEVFRASITPLNGGLLIRSDKYLYCVNGE